MQETDPVLALVERSNQRGGRMLSVPDLIEAGTLSSGQAAWILGRIRAGSSWLVGASPGGAGKTTVMIALLALLPPPPAIRLAEPGRGWERSRPGECVVAYEISPGAFDAYIWGAEVRCLAALAARGVRVVTNLHADTLAEAEAQIVAENGAAPGHFPAFGLFLPIAITGTGRTRHRAILNIYAAENGAWTVVSRTAAEAAAPPAITAFLETCRTSGLRTVAAVRQAWLAQ